MSAKWDTRFLRLAREVASWSKDPSTKTGAVIVDSNRQIVSVGFNGFPQGMPDDEALYANRDEKYSRIVHCEINALLFAGKLPAGCTLYNVPFMSCDRCVVQMLQAGIRRFVAQEATRDQKVRWGTAFDKTQRYIADCGATLDVYSDYEIKTGHRREQHDNCDRSTCVVCDLFICSVCGAAEGALLPQCPGKQLTAKEHDVNYAHYCASTGPFTPTSDDAWAV